MRRGIAFGALGLLVTGLAAVAPVAALDRPPPRDVGVFAVDVARGRRARISADPGYAAWARDGRCL